MDIVQELKGEIAVLREKVKSLEETIEKVALKANDNEQYSRRQNVRVTGFAEEKTKIVLLNLQGKIGLEVSDDTVNRAHRVGKKEEGANRTIIICLKTHKDILTMMKNRKNLKVSGFNIIWFCMIVFGYGVLGLLIL